MRASLTPQTDVLGQTLFSGDYVMITDSYSGKIYPGVYVKYNGNYHVQLASYSVDYESVLQDWTQRLERFNSTGGRCLYSVKWAHSKQRIIKIEASMIPEPLNNALDIIRELLIRTRKISI